jgi:endonuclease YncB( thermonuclease family)
MWRRAGLCVLVALLPTSRADAQTSAETPSAPPCTAERGEARAVAEVRDGETLRLDDGRMLRLIGALAPRAGDVGAPPGSWPPENEAHAALSALVEGRTITLWHDATRRDRYGQILAQATIGSGADTVWLQGALVTRGVARAYGRPGMDACTEELVRLERSARNGGLGLWSNAAYRVRDAADGDELLRATGSFRAVSGTVHRVSRGQGEVYVSLAPRGSRDGSYAFAAVVPSRGAALIGGSEPRALMDRRVIVRGWIEQRRGPVIVIDSKGMLELADE